jgi:predicted ATPase
MLTRLKVKGFKNLVDVEVRLGPLTCIAGPNGAGKSNMFDVIHFLSLLADKPFAEAASAVRGGADLRDLFTRGGDGRIVIECDVIIPRVGTDDFGQPAEASCTYLTYELGLRYEEQGGSLGAPRIFLDREHLSCTEGDAASRLGFDASLEWLDTVISDSARSTPFISIQGTDVLLRDDPMGGRAEAEGKGGKFRKYDIARLPRTVLSSAQDAGEHRTAVLLRQEMRRWRQLHLEPSALRRPDDFRDPPVIEPLGGHVATTLFQLASAADDPNDVYIEVANRLARLVDGVDSVRVDRDEGRRQFRLMMKDLHGVELPASSLSDGMLRFIALAVLEADSQTTGLICLEEPENGLHPQRIGAMLQLLEDMAVDPNEPADETNPLRQVVVSTHSPVVVANSRVDDVVFAVPVTRALGERVVRGLQFRGLAGTWRTGKGIDISTGVVLGYLDAMGRDEDDDTSSSHPRRTVKDVLGKGAT